MRIKGWLLIFVFVFLIKSVNAQSCSTSFVSGCTVDQNLTLSPGTYNVDNINFGANNVALDCNGAVLDGVTTSIPGIYVTNRVGIVIKNCNLTHYTHAITTNDVGALNDSIIENNNLYNVEFPMFLGMSLINGNLTSYRNIIRNNLIRNIAGSNIFKNFENLTFVDNTVENLYGGASSGGVVLVNSRNNLIENNLIKNIHGYYGGINLQMNSHSNRILKNTIINNDHGIRQEGGARSSIIANNTINYNGNKGIHLVSSPSNVILSNTIKFNGLGMGINTPIDGSPSFLDFNTILNNDFSDNSNPLDQVFTTINGTWSTFLSLGNHWSNFDNATEGCIDLNFPLNVCDFPKNISDGSGSFNVITIAKDFFPVKSMFLFAGLPPPTIAPIPDIAIDEGDTITITVIANNSFGVPENLIYSIDHTGFIQNNNIFSWQTNFNDAGNYNIFVDVTDGITSLHNFIYINLTINNANPECGSIPKNGCNVTQNTVFDNPSGNIEYVLKDGITIAASGITLDCNNVTFNALFYPNPVNDGIKMQNRNNNVIKNCNLRNYNHNMYILNSNNNTLENNNLRNAKINGVKSLSSNLNQFKSNTVKNNGIGNANGAGVYLQGSSSNQFINNIFKSNTNAFGGLVLIQSSNSNLIKQNIFDTNLNGIVVEQSTSNIVTENTVANSYGQGIRFLLGTSNNVAYRNNMINNGLVFGAAQMEGYATNQFSFNNQGNYYNTYDEPSEGCFDNNSNGFCDSPYVFPITNDPFPFTYQNGWNPIIVLEGSAAFGTTLNFIIQDIDHPNQPYIMAFSDSTSPPILLPNGLSIPLAGGQILITTIFFGPAVGLIGNVGILNNNGRANAQFSVPIPGLQGLTLYSAFVTADSSGNIVDISPAYSFTIQP